MTIEVIAERQATVLFRNAELPIKVTSLFPHKAMQLLILEVVTALSGHWIGGKALLFSDRLEFHPNVLNSRIYKGKDLDVAIQLSDISSVSVKAGIAADNVKIVTVPGRTFDLRCHQGARFASDTQAARSHP